MIAPDLDERLRPRAGADAGPRIPPMPRPPRDYVHRAGSVRRARAETRLLAVLAAGPATAGEIARALERAPSGVYRCLRRLARAGRVRSRAGFRRVRWGPAPRRWETAP